MHHSTVLMLMCVQCSALPCSAVLMCMLCITMLMLMCVLCTVKGSENASPRMLRLLSRPPCNSPFDEDEDEDGYTWMRMRVSKMRVSKVNNES